MKDITPLINQYYEKRKAKCRCTNGCRCQAAACMDAYTEAVIPEEYRNYTIDDFEGCIIENGKRKKVLEPSVVAKAKQQIINWCWKDIAEGEEYAASTWLLRCVLDQRHTDGNSLIIYGPKWVADKVAGKFKRKSSGKTMLAAIVLHEAIRLRVLPGHIADSYAWADYGMLVERLIAQSKGDNANNALLEHYADCDWLVVDGLSIIEKGTDLQKSYRANVLDHLFLERRDANLPTIFVFQDDITEVDDLPEQFGNAIYSIVNSRKASHVSLVG